MQIGIVGLPFSGKTTFFDTLSTHKVHDSSKKFKTEVIYFNPDINDKREFHMVDEKGNKYAINIKTEDENEEGWIMKELDEWEIIDKIKI